MRINRLIIGILLAVSAAWAGSLHAARATPALTELNTSPLHLRSAAALIVTQDTDKPLYTKNTRMQTPIASITKLMTAMVVLDAGLPLDEVLAISSEDLDLLRSTSSRLRVGGRFTRHELLQLAIMSSENRAASALSRNYPGGFAAFVTAMNRKAAELGMTQSTFVDATGLNSGNVSTAEDLARMVKAAYGYPEIREMTGRPNRVSESAREPAPVAATQATWSSLRLFCSISLPSAPAAAATGSLASIVTTW